MDINIQQKAPIYEALEEFKKEEWFHLTCLGTKEAGETRNWYSCLDKSAWNWT